MYDIDTHKKTVSIQTTDNQSFKLLARALQTYISNLHNNIMENLHLDQTQNRNLNFIKIFGLGLLTLVLLHTYLVESSHNFTENKQDDLPAKVCKIQQETPKNKKSI